MKTKAIEMLCHMRGVLCMLAALVFVFGATRQASAQWTVANAKAIWSGFNNAFYNTDSSGRGYYYQMQGSTHEEGFWTFAEEIEMAIDHYTWSLTNDSSNSATYKSQVLNLVNGFRNQHSDNWNSDAYDDDLSVAILAFVRCWEISGSGICLSDAENNFNTVYSRGYDTTYGGGLWWNYLNHTGSLANKSSSANWTFAIAGNLLYQATGDSSYKTKADTIYNWATSNLEDSSTGQVYNDVEASGTNKGLVSYNFGLAAGAATEEGQGTNATNIITYLIANVKGATVNGQNILPDYGNSNNGFGSFNAMTFRWLGVAAAHSYTPSNYLAWAQENISLGWADRNPIAMSWDDWIPDPPATHSPTTPSTGLYGPACTPLPTGMWWVPVP